jgi:hypothetical protein
MADQLISSPPAVTIYMTKPIKPRKPWRTVEDVELATAR